MGGVYSITDEEVDAWLRANGRVPPYDEPLPFLGLMAADILGVGRALPTYERHMAAVVARLNRRHGMVPVVGRRLGWRSSV